MTQPHLPTPHLPASVTQATAAQRGRGVGGDVPASSSLRSPPRSVCKACWDSEASPRKPRVWLVGSHRGELQARKGWTLESVWRSQERPPCRPSPLTLGLGMN